MSEWAQMLDKFSAVTSSISVNFQHFPLRFVAAIVLAMELAFRAPCASIFGILLQIDCLSCRATASYHLQKLAYRHSWSTQSSTFSRMDEIFASWIYMYPSAGAKMVGNSKCWSRVTPTGYLQHWNLGILATLPNKDINFCELLASCYVQQY